ncbi:MAG: ATP-binding protein [bacterium]
MRISSLLKNLQFKVLLLFLLIALAPLILMAAFSIRTAEDLIIRMASNQLGNVADDKVSLLERWLSERKADLRVVAESSILKSMNTEKIAPYLNLVEKYYEVYKGFVVLARDGNIIYNSLGDQLSYGLKDCNIEDSASRMYISNITFDPDHNDSFFYIYAPVFNDEGDLIGAVCSVVGTHSILSIILRVSLGETGESYLVDKEGTFLAHKEPRRILTENIAQSESFKNIFGEGSQRKIYTDYRGIEVLGTSRSIAGTDWFLVVEQDRDEAFMSADKLKQYAYGMIAFFIFAAIACAWLFSYYLVYPIRKLSEAAKILAMGDFEKARIETKRVDEIGLLYNAFEDMAKKLEARQNSLEKKVGLTEAELKETDVRLKKTQLAAARSEQMAALGRLAAGVTHEIRTPLASLKLFLQSVQSEIEISPEFEEDFQIGMTQIKRIEGTINRFLDFAKPQEPILSIIDIRHLIEDALLVIKPRANQQETSVKLKIEEGLPFIHGDKKQLAETLLNLIVNALEAMAHRGTLSIHAFTDQCEIGEHPCPCVRIDISDTGPGIPEENIPNLFEPFFTTKATGTGLGLPIAYSTIRMHGGDIRVENSPEGGTTFSIFLPVSVKGKESN